MVEEVELVAELVVVGVELVVVVGASGVELVEEGVST